MEEMMEEKRGTVIRDRLKAPRAGAIAGILFSILFIISLVVIRVSVPANPEDAGMWLSGSGTSVRLALNLLPFAGVAFLWFMGVLRDRMGDHEDRFFASVFLGSGLLFLATIFTFSAVVGGLMMASQSDSEEADGLRHLRVRPRRGLRDRQRLREKDGGSVHDLDLHARDPHRDIPALDGVPRLRFGAFAAPEPRVFLLGSAGLSAVDSFDQRICSPCQSSAQGGIEFQKIHSP
jgi:hypothetical protein